ncbi:membrane protein YczE [Streptomyces albireticuli]|uniref:membrane protein YczE n=1 Tax=Streptomyces albireticuli TaxID=1940 RepID=UPI00369A355E
MTTSGGPGPTGRLLRLYVGLWLYGVSAALQLRAGLGLAPWDVLNQGVARHTGLSIGTASVVIGAAVLLLWIPLRQRPGLGTVSNVLVIGPAMDATLFLVPAPGSLWARIPLLVFAIVLCAVATGLYISARFGAGPRDGLMTGLHRRTGRSVRLVRTCIEVAVLATGFALGGTVGAGTVLYALAIGPLSQFFLRAFAPAEPPATPAGPGAAPATAAAEAPAPAPAAAPGGHGARSSGPGLGTRVAGR